MIFDVFSNINDSMIIFLFFFLRIFITNNREYQFRVHYGKALRFLTRLKIGLITSY